MRQMQQSDELRIRILNAAVTLFREKGLKFTMDDIAHLITISKKTIYTVFSDKETLFLQMVDYGFDAIKESEQKVLNDESLSTLEKIRCILGVMPDSYKDLEFGRLFELKDQYPAIYKRVEERLESGWEPTLRLIEKGIDEGVVRPINTLMIKTMFEATLEQFFKRDILVRNQIPYYIALDQVVDILMHGISKKEDK